MLEALKDPDWNVRAHAASLLGDIGSERAIEPLVVLLADPMVCREAIYALGRIGKVSAVPGILSTLRSDDTDIRDDTDVRMDAVFWLSMILGNHDVFNEELTYDVDNWNAAVEQMVVWWDSNERRFDPNVSYESGEPASIGRAIERLSRSRRPDAFESEAARLCVYTGQSFHGSVESQIEAWRNWWRDHDVQFPTGRRYFWGRPSDSLGLKSVAAPAT